MRIPVLAAALSIAVVACGSYAQVDPATPSALVAPAPPPPPPPPPLAMVGYSGLTAEVHVLELVARDDGEVAEVRVVVGQRVRAGDVLVLLAVGDLPARIDEAERALAVAQQDLAAAGQQLRGYEAAYQEELHAGPDRDRLRY